MFMRASDIMGDDGGDNSRGTTPGSRPGSRPGTGGYSSGPSTPGRHGNMGYGYGSRPVTSASSGGYSGRRGGGTPDGSRPSTTSALDGNLGLAGALPSTESRRSMLQRQAELQRKRRAARRAGGFMATSRPTIDGPDAPRSPMANPQRTRSIPQFSAPRYMSKPQEPTVVRTAGYADVSGGGKEDREPPIESGARPMSSGGSASGMSLAEVIRERERMKQRDTRSPTTGTGMSAVERQMARSGIPASYDPGVSRASMAESKEGAVALDLSDMPAFLTQPTPRSAGVVQCYIHRFKSGMNKLFPLYHVFMKDGDRFLLAAKKRSKQRTSNYLISSNKDDLSRTGPNFVGKLRSNFVGTEFTVYNNGVNPKDAGGDTDRLRTELALVTYASNVLGSKGPRKMKVCVPRVDPKTNERILFQPTGKEGEMLGRLKANDLTDMVYMINKPPRWNEAVGAYVLNFNGRVTMASVKNFQLVDPEDQENVLLQFGRVGKDVFNMDYRWPLSPLQAFAICLSSFDYKIACE